MRVLFILFVSSFLCFVHAQITWPEGQLLPTFPASAETQDLIYLNGSITPYADTPLTWQAEDTGTQHETGRLENEGWLCEPNVDTANKYMLYGQYDKNVTSGQNVAEFRLRIDNNTANNDEVAEIDVRNATTGTVLATKLIRRQDFTNAQVYILFTLPFLMSTDNQEIELRILWKGKTYLKVDYVRVRQDNRDAEYYLFSSLKGLINRVQPRIFSYEGDALAEGPYTWLQSLGYKYNDHKTNTWNVLTKYKSEIDGIIIYDPAQIHTVNYAIPLAHKLNALIVAPSLVDRLTSSPYNYQILEDLRGRFNSEQEIYQAVYDNHWPSADKRILIGLSPIHHKASLREYAIGIGASVIWLDPKKTAESNLLNKFLKDMPVGANCMGWWPEEEPGVTRVSNYGFTTIPSDYATNLAFHSGTSREIKPAPMPAKPQLENKIYVAFILSDGDNLQYIEHLQRKLWNNKDRGSVPIGWTISPSMVDAMPAALNHMHESSTENDNLISGPSGYGYTYPNNWLNYSLGDELAGFVAKTEEYNYKAGIRVITIWNTITGGINSTVGTSFANNSRTLLGLTAQNTGGVMSIYGGTRDPDINRLPGKPLSCNYCTNEQAMKDHIASAAKNWNGNSPRFAIIQAQPWNNVTPTSFKNVANSLGADYVVVRPDHIFQLIREANNLTINPGAIEGEGEGLTADYFNGMNFETKIASRIDKNVNFNWDINAPMDDVNADNFSVRWTGQVAPRYSGYYTFYVTADNGCKLWVDNKLVIDKWTGNQGIAYSATVKLDVAQKYDLKLEYYDNRGAASCKLEWASAFESREVIPQSQLFKDISSTGLISIDDAEQLKVFPSKLEKGMVNIELKDAGRYEKMVYVHDLSGKLLMSQSFAGNHFQVNMTNYAKGVYLISVQSNRQNKTIRFMYD